MNRMPRGVLRALEALAQSPINNSALAIAETTDLSHDTLCRALEYPLPKTTSSSNAIAPAKTEAASSVSPWWSWLGRKLPLAFLPHFAGEGSELELALALLSWAREEGFQRLLDGVGSAKQVMMRCSDE